MNHESLIRDAVFQLNLLLWMAKEQPHEAFVVRPVYHALGFRLIYIEHPFKFPQESLNAIDASTLAISREPEPEVILGREADRHALYFEAKADSFSPDSDNSKQARGHLLATGPAFAEVMAPLSSCLLCYLVPEGKRDLMHDCLDELAQQLSDAGLEPGPHSTHGLSVVDRELRYSWDEAFKKHVAVDGDGAVVMHDLEEDTDPNPLLLVYSVEDYPDRERQDLLRQSLIDQVHALLLSELHRLAPGAAYERSADSLLVEMTDGVFHYLGRHRQKEMQKLVRTSILRRIHDYCQDRFEDTVTLTGGVLRISFPDQDGKTSFLDWFEDAKRTAFSVKKPPQKSLPLFPDLDDD
ncbi:MAG: hypothetical protein NTY19_48300 [Planctomycetota bacterium]|nr:hypothetical protein [Planctomycetota bacterium]